MRESLFLVLETPGSVCCKSDWSEFKANTYVAPVLELHLMGVDSEFLRDFSCDWVLGNNSGPWC